jgi:radical SAM superfamily enzyme YgiQ (UPF0313 family)
MSNQQLLAWHQRIPWVGNIQNPTIVLAAINAGYVHAHLGLRYLLANLGALESLACILEGTRRLGAHALAEAVASLKPRILGLSVSIWNQQDSIRFIERVRELLPHVVIVVGGPEASYLPLNHGLFFGVDVLLRGESELVFVRLSRFILGYPTFRRPKGLRVFQGRIFDLSQVQLPYRLLQKDDLINRILYVETSRGCPFRCEFCLSSRQGRVRFFPLEPVLDEIRQMYLRGGRYFKVIDRTFNANIPRAKRTLEFFLDLFTGSRSMDLPSTDSLSRVSPTTGPPASVQFEVVPDRLPHELRELIAQFPPGMLRLEVGVQTMNNEVADRIHRKQDQQATWDNLTFLLHHTQAIVHADLIIGLPGEDLESFARGFDRLWNLGPQEVQLGILKALPGTTLHRHDPEFGMVYNPDPPYEIIETKAIPKYQMEKLKRAAKYWELVVNRGRYPDLVDRLLPRVDSMDYGDQSTSTSRNTGMVYPTENGPSKMNGIKSADGLFNGTIQPSPFNTFLGMSDYLYDHFGRTWGIDASELGKVVESYVLSANLIDQIK